MKAFGSTYRALSISAVAVMLSGCGGSSTLAPSAGTAVSGVGAPSGSQTFDYTGAEQTFKVPTGVTSINVVADGAGGYRAGEGSVGGGSGGPGGGGSSYVESSATDVTVAQGSKAATGNGTITFVWQ